MRLVLLASCTFLVMGVASAGSDSIYRWKGADGKIYYGDTPPAAAQEVRNFDSRFAGPSATAVPKGTTAEPAAEGEVATTTNAAECAQKQGQVKAYRNATQLIERDSLGREREYTADERKQLIARVEAEMETVCGGAQPQ